MHIVAPTRFLLREPQLRSLNKPCLQNIYISANYDRFLLQMALHSVRSDPLRTAILRAPRISGSIPGVRPMTIWRGSARVALCRFGLHSSSSRKTTGKRCIALQMARCGNHSALSPVSRMCLRKVRTVPTLPRHNRREQSQAFGSPAEIDAECRHESNHLCNRAP